MPEKPKHAYEYAGDQVELVRATCLYVATKLGDMMDEMVVVGGLVPSLLVKQDTLPSGAEAHVGTLDLDLGLRLTLLDDGRYRTLTERLRDAGFTMDSNDAGHPTRQRWIVPGSVGVAVDFLIPPSLPGDQGGRLRNIEPDFAAIIAPGLRLAFVDKERVILSGVTALGENATREVWVSGAGAFIVQKALAFDGRGANKDAYDLYYVLRNYGGGVDDVLARLRPLLHDLEAQRALAILRRDFLKPDSVGPRRVADFTIGAQDDELQADVVSFVTLLLLRCGSGAPARDAP